jgi:Fe2+ transport system protein FeoA
MDGIELLAAARNAPLRVVSIGGGEGLRRRLFSLGLRPGDEIEYSVRGIFGGPVLVRNLRSGMSVALGRGIARRIRVEACLGPL